MSGGLTMKRFSKPEGDSASSLDFSHLENNPNYKPEPVEPVEPVEPTEPIEPVEPTEPVEPVEPTEPTEPVEPVEPTEPTEPVEPTPSSLNNEPEPSGEVQLTDELVNKYLSEKLGEDFDYNNIQQPVELDPDIKAINEWKEKTGRPIEDFFKYQKDYSQVDDLDVAREALQLEYPTLTPEELELEMEQFIALEEDLGNEAAKKSLALKKYATKGRELLNGLKTELSKPDPNTLTPEVKQKLEFAEQIQKQINENKDSSKLYAEGVTKAATSTEKMTLNLSDDVTLDYEISVEDRQSIPTLIDEMPHWRNEDGSWNHQAVVNDAIKIKDFDKMIKLAYEQGLNSGKDDLIKQTKNTNLDGGSSKGSQQNQGNKKPIIEDIDKLLGKQKLSMKGFGKR